MNKRPWFLLVGLTLTSLAAGVLFIRSGVGCGAVTETRGLLYSKEDLNLHVERWKARDGVAGKLISDYFCDFATLHPESFLETMADHREIFDEWVDGLDDLSFVSYGGCVDLNCRRRMMIDAFSKADLSQPELQDTLLARLTEIRVRTID